MEDSNSIIKVKPPKKIEIYTIRMLIFMGVLTILIFLIWFFGEDRIGYPYLFWPLTIAVFFKFLRTLHEWYHYWNVSIPIKPVSEKKYTVDIFTTWCPGEPRDMVIQTMEAMQAIYYPHTSYLCDEGDDPALKKECERLGVVHVTRKEKIDAKAGNINNALKQATGEIAIILDPDHIPIPEFIDQVLPYFEDSNIGFVQSVQAYYNKKESLVALGACEQTYHFYGPMMMAMNSYGTAQAIGANCAFRRTALDSIGGHAAGLAEDMHTSMLLHAKGWKSIYVPEILTRGLVPSSLPGYYKQQLKWSRGTFDLFFGVLPGIFKNLTWRQRLHYATIPLYFFYGIIDFVNILIPVLSLVLAEFPWQVDLIEFFRMSIPILIMTLLIRQYSQRWLLEKQERGFHMVGGLLRIGTWWVFALGFIYTLLKIKVPYIPTPKDGEPENSWSLCTSNIVACLISIGAIIYGLYIDRNPYTYFMALLAFMNVLILGYVVAIGQQKLLVGTFKKINDSKLNKYVYPSRLLWWNLRHTFYTAIRSSSLAIGILTIVLFVIITYNNKEEYNYNIQKNSIKRNSGGFYAGYFLEESMVKPFLLNLKASSIGKKEPVKIISFNESWALNNRDTITAEFLKQISVSGFIPMITWSPDSLRYCADKKVLNKNSSLFSADVLSGKYDDVFLEYATKMRLTESPIFLRFAPDFDLYLYQTSIQEKNNYINAWKYIVKFFEREAISNVIWIWNAPNPESLYEFFPGKDYVDWIAIGCKNFKSDDQFPAISFKQFYDPFRKQLEQMDLLDYPIMLSEWDLIKNTNGARMNLNNFPEIQSIVIGGSDSCLADQEFDLKIENLGIKNTASGIKASYYPIKKNSCEENSKIENSFRRSKFLRGEKGSFELLVDKKPFFIKGVSYSSSSFLVKDKLPLTRSQLKKDFQQIKDMGANTIRRYNSGIYDRNVLMIANEFDLKVIYGFTLDPDVDYLQDTVKLNQYFQEVEKMVLNYKDYPSVLGWALGNETYSSLKYFYQKPYLNSVRRAYIDFIEKVSRRIHELDPDKPVFAIIPHTNILQGAVADFHKYAPSVDIMGINSHDKDDLKAVQKIMSDLDYNRPYIISEFSAGGYWNEYVLEMENGMVIEMTDHEKGNQYFWNWIKYIEFKKGYNLGGIAYSWRDKPEGTATWFGITDIKGRLKPSYYRLQKVWKRTRSSIPMPWVIIQGPMEISSDESYEYNALEEYEGNFTYEWYLQSEKKMEYLGKLEGIGEGRTVRVTIPPAGNSDLRLYVYVSDGKGNVVSASFPLKIKK